MQFRKNHSSHPEISLIPFIDILLVLLIFLVLSTTYTRYSSLQIQLPQAQSDNTQNLPETLSVSITQDGWYVIGQQRIRVQDTAMLHNVLSRHKDKKDDTVLLIHADALASHQSVVHVMDIARQLDIQRISFTTQNSLSDFGTLPTSP
jgi:biopolymer transport protein ExbD